jgi:hypothetical protein
METADHKRNGNDYFSFSSVTYDDDAKRRNLRQHVEKKI